MYQLNKTVTTNIGILVELHKPIADFEGTFYDNKNNLAIARIALINGEGTRYLKTYSWNTNGESWPYEKVVEKLLAEPDFEGATLV